MQITTDTNISNICNENINVVSHCLIIHGILNGNIKVQRNAVCIIHGIVNGNIDALNGSSCKIFGIVRGFITGLAEIDAHAIVQPT